LQPAQLTV